MPCYRSPRDGVSWSRLNCRSQSAIFSTNCLESLLSDPVSVLEPGLLLDRCRSRLFSKKDLAARHSLTRWARGSAEFDPRAFATFPRPAYASAATFLAPRSGRLPPTYCPQSRSTLRKPASASSLRPIFAESLATDDR